MCTLVIDTWLSSCEAELIKLSGMDARDRVAGGAPGQLDGGDELRGLLCVHEGPDDDERDEGEDWLNELAEEDDDEVIDDDETGGDEEYPELVSKLSTSCVSLLNLLHYRKSTRTTWRLSIRFYRQVRQKEKHLQIYG